MTDEAVHISITIKVEKGVYEFGKEVRVSEMEEGVQAMVQEIGQRGLKEIIEVWVTACPSTLNYWC
jgi:hypothetical protein